MNKNNILNSIYKFGQFQRDTNEVMKHHKKTLSSIEPLKKIIVHDAYIT